VGKRQSRAAWRTTASRYGWTEEEDKREKKM
jgi:hypothetical protein